MFACPSPLGLNGACAMPRKPGWPGSAQGMCPILGDEADERRHRRVGRALQLRQHRAERRPAAGRLIALRPGRSCTGTQRGAAVGADDRADRRRTCPSSAAMRGNCSQISMPGTLVLIGLNSPRISAGASIFRSNMSWCGGPPGRKIMMIALCERRIPARLRPAAFAAATARPAPARRFAGMTPRQPVAKAHGVPFAKNRQHAGTSEFWD